MEEGVYLNASQRAIIAARMTDPPGPVFQAEAARRLRVGRSSIQRAANLVKPASDFV